MKTKSRKSRNIHWYSKHIAKCFQLHDVTLMTNVSNPNCPASGFLPRLLSHRTRMSAAFTRDKAMVRSNQAFIMACGGLPLLGSRPSRACWRLVGTHNAGSWIGNWEVTPDMKEGVAGAAMAWFQNKMWVIGGAKGDDKKVGTKVSDKVR